MQKLTTLNDLRQNMESYIQKIRKGGSFVVYRRSEPVFRIGPAVEERWDEVIDFTKIQKGGVDIDAVLERL